MTLPAKGTVRYIGKNKFEFVGPTENDWVLVGFDGASMVSEPRLTLVKYYGGGYTYLCQAAVGSARSGAVWLIIRKTDATGDMVYAGTGEFDQQATDLATVAALTYTLEA